MYMNFRRGGWRHLCLGCHEERMFKAEELKIAYTPVLEESTALKP